MAQASDNITTIPNSLCGCKVLRKGFISILAFLAPLAAFAQSRVAADVEVKTLLDGKVTTVTKREFCNGNGRLVTVFISPSRYIITTNLQGEMSVYNPATKETFSDRGDEFSTKDNLLYLFLSGRSADLGLASYGYSLQKSQAEEGGYLKRTYTTRQADKAPAIEVVLKDYLPVYVAYLNGSGDVMSKTYLSGYDFSSGFVFPTRVTGIDYLKDRDSTVTRTIYSNVRTNSTDAEFSFEIPSDAVTVEKPFQR